MDEMKLRFSPSQSQRNKLFYLARALNIFPVNPKHLIRVGPEGDGGYSVANYFENIEVCSLGIENEIQKDLFFSEKNIKVYAYDNSIEQYPINDNRIYFEKLTVSGDSGTNRITLNEIIERTAKNVVVFMDIEGSEWDVLSKVDLDYFERIDQLIIEFHNLDAIFSDKEEAYYRISIFNKLMFFKPIIINANNWTNQINVDGYNVPTTIEVTYVSDKIYEKIKGLASNPINFRFPNTNDAPWDKELRFLNYHILHSK
jgi:hypothetical protein